MSYKLFLAFLAGILVSETVRIIHYSAFYYNSEKVKTFVKRFMEH